MQAFHAGGRVQAFHAGGRVQAFHAGGRVQAFHADVNSKRGMVIIYRGMLYATMFYRGWGCFSRGWHSRGGHNVVNR